MAQEVVEMGTEEKQLLSSDLISTELAESELMTLAGRISSTAMQIIAVQKLGFGISEVKTLSSGNRENQWMMKFELLDRWKNKNGKNSRKELARLLREVSTEDGIIDANVVDIVLKTGTATPLTTEFRVDKDVASQLQDMRVKLERETTKSTQLERKVLELEEKLRQIQENETEASGGDENWRKLMNQKEKLRKLKEIHRNKQYEVVLLSTHSIGIEQWLMGFTVMPQTGQVLLTGAEKLGGSCSLFVYNFKDGILSKKKNICLPCGHKTYTYVNSLTKNGQDQLFVSCEHCMNIKLLDLQSEECTVAFSEVAGELFDAGSGKLFVNTGNSILPLNFSAPVFKGALKNVYRVRRGSNISYIPPPVDALVLSHAGNLKLVALSFEKDEVIWEFSFNNGNMKRCLLFHPENNVLLADDGLENELLIIKPENGCQTQKIDLPKIGRIDALSLFQDQIVMLHAADEEFKISYLYLVGI